MIYPLVCLCANALFIEIDAGFNTKITRKLYYQPVYKVAPGHEKKREEESEENIMDQCTERKSVKNQT